MDGHSSSTERQAGCCGGCPHCCTPGLALRRCHVHLLLEPPLLLPGCCCCGGGSCCFCFPPLALLANACSGASAWKASAAAQNAKLAAVAAAPTAARHASRSAGVCQMVLPRRREGRWGCGSASSATSSSGSSSTPCAGQRLRQSVSGSIMETQCCKIIANTLHRQQVGVRTQQRQAGGFKLKMPLSMLGCWLLPGAGPAQGSFCNDGATMWRHTCKHTVRTEQPVDLCTLCVIVWANLSPSVGQSFQLLSQLQTAASFGRQLNTPCPDTPHPSPSEAPTQLKAPPPSKPAVKNQSSPAHAAAPSGVPGSVSCPWGPPHPVPHPHCPPRSPPQTLLLLLQQPCPGPCLLPAWRP